MKRTQNRREFLRKVSLTTLSIPILGSCASGQTRSSSDVGRIKNNADRSGAIWSGAKDAPNDVTSYSKLANENENGERLIISGTVFMHDGKAPAPNILIYAYHTDIKGIYGKGNEPTHGRFRGWMLTDSKGRYEIDTIKPGPYPTGGTPAHIHYTLTGISFKEDWVDSVLFKGDEKITEGIVRDLSGKGGYNPVIALTKNANGTLRGVRDIKLEKAWV